MQINVDEFVAFGKLGPFSPNMSLRQLEKVASSHSLDLVRFREDQHFYFFGHVLFDCSDNPTAAGCNISLYFPHPSTSQSGDFNFSTWPDPRINWILKDVNPGLLFDDAAKLFPKFEQRKNQYQTADLSNRKKNVTLIFDKTGCSDQLQLLMVQACHRTVG